MTSIGLLSALDHFYKPTSEARAHEAVLEYQLTSWGEIFSPFMGDREHSTAARFILNNFPFKLFSTSTPYDGGLPQKLTATFVAPFVQRRNSARFKSSGMFCGE